MKRMALLIGINNYKFYENFPLDGCLNDLEIIASVLKEKFGFQDKEITFLREKQATRKAIIAELKNILETCEPDSLVVLHFSGHGTRRVSPEPDKPDGLDETIIPYDSSQHPLKHSDIRDSDLHNWLALLMKKTKNVCFFCDSCYSGSITRNQEKIRGIETDKKDSLDFLTPAERKALAQNIFPSPSEKLESLSGSYTLLASCRKNEYSREYTKKPGEVYGAFTHFLVQALRNVSENSSYQDVFEELSINMELLYPSQHPQIKGNKTSLIFEGKEKETIPYVLIKERDWNEVVIAAGTSHGVTKKSIWIIYSASEKNLTAETAIGKIRIKDVGVITSKAIIIEEETNQKIKVGAHAVESMHFYGNKKPAVFISPPSPVLKPKAKILTGKIKESSWLKTTNREKLSEYVVSLSKPDELSRDNDEIKAEIRQTRDGQVLLQLSYSEDDYQSKIREALEKLVKFSMVSKLSNPSSKLKNRIEFTLLQKIKGEWLPAKNRHNDLPLYYESEQIAFQIINSSPTSIYLSLLDLGLTKRINLLYPKGESEGLEKKRAAPGGVVENPNLGILKGGVMPGEKITLSIPKEAFVTKLDGINKIGGIEIFKLMITTEQTDFSWIQQPGIRLKRRSSPLEELMYLYLSEDTTREAGYEFDEFEDWLTINRSFYLCKK